MLIIPKKVGPNHQESKLAGLLCLQQLNYYWTVAVWGRGSAISQVLKFSCNL